MKHVVKYYVCLEIVLMVSIYVIQYRFLRETTKSKTLTQVPGSRVPDPDQVPGPGSNRPAPIQSDQCYKSKILLQNVDLRPA